MTARRRPRAAPVAAMLAGLGLIAVPTVAGWQPRIIWNASASVPLGLYIAVPTDDIALGDLVLVRPPETLAAFLAERGYIARGVPLLKHVVALPPQRVCAAGHAITVDGETVAHRRMADRLGRRLPTWHGCHRLESGEVFLLNPAEPDSLDGRYFEPLPRTSIVARLRPVWITGRGP
ncbi:S26 family signal peptidase [Paeniroseomonas aquatica]|uniref:S26 family signal peptidase n=1 Tax=Paeniroseomonas aquatica TaxID=373043 RepID=A0ABT8A247_9PROT|nr:S26 family signal peptidase [Paeniroseomonas aquatica]MDN3563701.1 S26 family signal peptidase [Paeniroseomonas aquatica]